MSVVVGVTEGRTAVAVFLVHTHRRGRAASSPCWSASAREGAAPSRQHLVTKLEMEWGQKEGLLPLMAS